MRFDSASQADGASRWDSASGTRGKRSRGVKGGLGRVARGRGLIHFGDGAESVSPAISEAVAFISVADSTQLRGGAGSHPS